jgi:DNA-binding transcriptional LysR family regulator
MHRPPAKEGLTMIDKLRSDLDIRLLRTLHLLLSESGVSRVAGLLGQSQPAVSAALKRLRIMLGDPLLVRGAGGRLVPSERGVQLIDVVGRILADFRPALRRTGRFRSSHSAAPQLLAAIASDLHYDAGLLDLRIVAELPMTPTGKVSKAQLAALALAGAAQMPA